MKFLKFVLISVLILFVIFCVFIFYLIHNFDVNRFKPAIVSALSQAVGGKADITDVKIEFSMKEGLGLSVNGIDINIQDPDYDLVFHEKELLLSLDIMPFIAQRAVSITRIQVSKPKVQLTRYPEGGNTSFHSPDPSPSVGEPSLAVSTDTAPVKNQTNTMVDLSKLNIKSVLVRDGEVILINKVEMPVIMITLNHVDMEIRDFYLNRPFEFLMDFGFLNNKKNFKLKGAGTVKIEDVSVDLDNAQGQWDLSSIIIDELNSSFPQTRDFKLTSLDGEALVKVKHLTLDLNGLKEMSAEADMEVKINSKILSSPASMSLAAALNENQVDVDHLILKIEGGEFRMTGLLKDYLTHPGYQMKIDIKDIQLNAFVPEFPGDVELFGKASGQMEAEGKVSDVNLTVGRGQLLIKEGRLTNINIFRDVLNKMTLIPSLYDTVVSHIPEQYKDILSKSETAIDLISLDLAMADKWVHLNDIRLQTAMVEALASGRISWDQYLTLDAKVSFPQDISTNIATSVPEMKGLLNTEEMIEIPLSQYNGNAEKIRMFPDMEIIGKKIIVSRGKDELNRLLGDVFGQSDSDENTGESNPNTPQEQNPDEPATHEEPIPIEQQIIENIFDSIFQ